MADENVERPTVDGAGPSGLLFFTMFVVIILPACALSLPLMIARVAWDMAEDGFRYARRHFKGDD